MKEWPVKNVLVDVCVFIGCLTGRETGRKNSGLIFQAAAPQKLHKGTRRETFVNKINIEIGFGVRL